jgi:hypothetical protein
VNFSLSVRYLLGLFHVRNYGSFNPISGQQQSFRFFYPLHHQHPPLFGVFWFFLRISGILFADQCSSKAAHPIFLCFNQNPLLFFGKALVLCGFLLFFRVFSEAFAGGIIIAEPGENNYSFTRDPADY